MLDKIRKYISHSFAFVVGNIFAYFFYDKQFIGGKHFEGKYGGISGVGWKWIVTDCMARIFLGINKGIPFPISPKMNIVNPYNIKFHIDDLNNFQSSGNYYQAINGATITIGKGSWIAQNVGIITSNHDISNPDYHLKGEDVYIGEKCWIGMNSVILPGVVLGPNTTVGAGSIVTKSFPEGNCVIAGNPARKIKTIQVERKG